MRFLIDSKDHFETGKTGETGKKCKKEPAYVCNRVVLDLKNICDFSLFYSGSFKYFDSGDDIVNLVRQYNSDTGSLSGMLTDNLTL